MTAVFLFVIMGATHGKAPAGFAPLAIGLALTLIHLVSIPVTNTSVNPARSTGPALFVGGWAIAQLWLFWVAPLARRRAGAFAIAGSAKSRPHRSSAKTRRRADRAHTAPDACAMHRVDPRPAAFSAAC